MKNKMINDKGVLYKIGQFFKVKPLIAWNIISILLIFISPWLSLITVWISLVGYNKRKKELYKQYQEKLVSDANNFVNDIQNKKALTTIKPSIFLEKDEFSFLEETTVFQETRAVRDYSAGTRSVGFRVAKGVRVGFGGIKGSSHSHQEWSIIDQGQLTITNKRLVFSGSKETKVIPLAKILSINTGFESIEISIESRSKKVIFSVSNGYIWSTVINILKSVDDPLKLGDIKLDIKFQ